jgi:hypothetical protein
LKIAVGLLVIIVIAMAAGTIIDSRSGPEAAGRAVYYSLWFQLLLGLFALNVACSLIDLWPWGAQRTGFALTHGSMLLILAGALVSAEFKVEGKLALWEGDQSDFFTSSAPQGDGTAETHPALPFSVRLDAFEIDYYQGTRRPAMFRSRVTVTDKATGHTFPAVIQMNQELSYAGYKLFQSSYQQTPGRDQTVLSVSRDPGQMIVFAGYGLLMVGMVTVLLTRVAQRRAAMAFRTGRTVAIGSRRVAALALGTALAGLGALATPARAAALPDAADAGMLRRLPVQHDGRVMPLDTLAREAVWHVTGDRASWRGIDAVSLVLGWTFDPRDGPTSRCSRSTPAPSSRRRGFPPARHGCRSCRWWATRK